MKRKGSFLLGEETVEALIAILVIVFLVVLAYLLFYKGFATSRAETVARNELTNLNQYFETASSDKTTPYPVLRAKDWLLISTELKSFCGAKNGFCLCLCSDFNCGPDEKSSSKSICIETSRFVLLRAPATSGFLFNERHFLSYDQDEFQLSRIDQEVYPYSAYRLIDGISLTTPITNTQGFLFFKYASLTSDSPSEWLWSTDLSTWQTTETDLSEYRTLDERKKTFIQSVMRPIKSDEPTGKEIFTREGVSLSRGVDVIEVTS